MPGDIGTGARTVLTQIAADELDVPLERVRVEIGDSSFGQAMLAGGSMGTSSWGAAVVKACRMLRTGETEVHVYTSMDADAEEPLSKHGFGAQFVEVRVDADTCEIRVPRVLGVFACGRIVNPKTARSQFIGVSRSALDAYVKGRYFLPTKQGGEGIKPATSNIEHAIRAYRERPGGKQPPKGTTQALWSFLAEAGANGTLPKA